MKLGLLYKAKKVNQQEINVAVASWKQSHNGMPNMVIVNQNDDRDGLLRAPSSMTIVHNTKVQPGHIRLVLNPKKAVSA